MHTTQFSRHKQETISRIENMSSSLQASPWSRRFSQNFRTNRDLNHKKQGQKPSTPRTAGQIAPTTGQATCNNKPATWPNQLASTSSTTDDHSRKFSHVAQFSPMITCADWFQQLDRIQIRPAVDDSARLGALFSTSPCFATARKTPLS